MSAPNLSPEVIERLTLLIEEASEVQQAATKILRHGWQAYDGYHHKSYNNGQALGDEVADLLSVVDILVEKGDLSRSHIDDKDLRHRKRYQKYKYCHHQKIPEDLLIPCKDCGGRGGTGPEPGFFDWFCPTCKGEGKVMV